MQYTTEILPHGTQVWVNDIHKIGTDALLLARFCGVRPRWRVCDLGTGCGVILLSLWDEGLRGASVGLDIEKDAIALLQGAAQQNGFKEIQALQTDLRQYKPDILFDLVTANPPYFTGGLVAAHPARAAARHQLHGTLQDFCSKAAQILKDGGRFCVCYPATGLAALFAAMQAARLQPKRLQLVRKHTNQPPWLALVDSRKNGGVGLGILPDIVLPPGQAVHY